MELRPNQLRLTGRRPAGFVWHHAVAGGPGTNPGKGVDYMRFSIRHHGEKIFPQLINGANETET
jgi:hypothetical protein